LRVLSLRALRRIRTVQDRLLRLLGSPVERRTSLVAAMLERNANEATSYWLQLLVSIGIATLGLVVGSTAVIIGAMLVAPLMGPIIALAMGLATGSPFLVLRSAARIVASVIVTITGAALITVFLPFHELNGEIGARTFPTALDLLTAGFCALAGVYASLRTGSDTATTAAGTSIGISLVPPLCASGYGLGTGMWPVAGGAALLFLTNLVAIIFVGTLSFVAAGFNRVNVTGLEREELSKNQKAVVTAAISRHLAGLFESKAGPALRFLMPLLLLAAVYLPLRRALDEVAWQVRVRAAIDASIKRERHKIVQSRVRVERHEVDVLVVLLGKTSDAESARARLDDEIRKVANVAPRLDVLAIPDSAAFAGLESSLRTSREILPLTPLTPPRPELQLAAAQELIRSTVGRLWPSGVAGAPLVIEVGTAEDGPLRVRVVHQGAALGADGIEGVSRSLAEALKHEVQLVDVAVPAEPLTRAAGDLKFIARVAAAVKASAPIAALNVCVEQPRPPPKRGRLPLRDQELAESLREVLAPHPRVTTTSGDRWRVRFARESCTAAPPPATAAGETAAGTSAGEAATSH
jgi:uncharacterized hydrophobic protein (TIGR00271 family)